MTASVITVEDGEGSQRMRSVLTLLESFTRLMTCSLQSVVGYYRIASGVANKSQGLFRIMKECLMLFNYAYVCMLASACVYLLR